MESAITSLAKVLKYKNTQVIARFCDDFSFPEDDAKLIFKETLKWLWLCAKHSQLKIKTPLMMFNEAQAIDHMWHCFLLFTQDYENFCERYLGSFVHHVPLKRSEKNKFQAKLKRSPKLARAERVKLMQPTYEFIYDELGEDTLVLWAEKFAEKYDRYFISK